MFIYIIDYDMYIYIFGIEVEFIVFFICDFEFILGILLLGLINVEDFLILVFNK